MQLTLTNRLRMAALTRAERGGRIVGTFVIDSEGVIDLRALEDRGPLTRASDPAALGDIAGKFGDAADVSSLYASSPERQGLLLRRRRKRGGRPPSSGVGSSDSVIDLTEPTASTEDHAAETRSEPTASIPPPPPPPDPVTTAAGGARPESEQTEVSPSRESDPVIDLRDDRGPSSLQAAIAEFNRFNPFIADVPERDIESGIRFGRGGAADKVERPPLFGSDHLTDEPANSTHPSPISTEIVCPMCGGAASRDFANRVLEIDFYSCDDCFHMWHVAADSGDT